MRIAVTLGMFLALVSPSSAGVAALELWPKRVIEIALCSASDPDPGDRKLCGKNKPLDGRITDLVRQAIVTWNKTFKDHITFQETKVYKADVVRVYASAKSSSCFVNNAGYFSSQPTIMSIGTACARALATKEGSVLHEMGHIVGLHHEQRRPDRDDYIKLDLKKLQSIARSGQENKIWAYQYVKLCDVYSAAPCSMEFVAPEGPASIFGREYARVVGQYDFASVMAYPLFPPHKDPKEARGDVVVDVTAVGAVQLINQHISSLQVGQRDGLSLGDVASIKSLYPRSSP